ncbi:MAG TPA: cation diffusion facilitator family transporter [Burkholderiales bacterium]|nr:cation diffusion facilitator family transporter [Burkholderiales bacterium]
MPTGSTGLERYAWLSIGTAVVTLVIKWAAWWLTGSVGLLSDALEAFVNLGAALMALWMLRVAASPPDEKHPYGLSKAEYFAAAVEGTLIVLAAAAIIAAALPRLAQPKPIDTPLLGLALGTLAAIFNLVVARLLIRAGRENHSITLEADGHHLMTDVWTSAGVVGGVAIVWASGWLILDPLIAIAVGINIIWTGVGLMRRSVLGLLDAAIPGDDLHEIDKLFREYGERYGVAFHALRTRQAGARRFVTFHLLVPDAWTVKRAHELSEELESRIRSLVPNANLVTHIEPISDPASYDDEPLDRP